MKEIKKVECDLPTDGLKKQGVESCCTPLKIIKLVQLWVISVCLQSLKEHQELDSGRWLFTMEKVFSWLICQKMMIYPISS